MVLEDLAAVHVDFDVGSGVYTVSDEAVAKLDVAGLEASIAGDLAVLNAGKPVSGIEDMCGECCEVPTLGDGVPGFTGHF